MCECVKPENDGRLRGQDVTLMKMIKKIEPAEMIWRWARGEVDSPEFFPAEDSYRREVREKLEQNDPVLNEKGVSAFIKRSRRGVGPISLSEKWTWYLASLTISAKEFASLYTNDDVKWRRYTNNTLRLIDAAGFLAGYPGEDRRIDGILGKLTCDCYVNSSGITLLKRDNGDGYDIEEGNGRLAAICIHYLIRKANEPRLSEIDVVVGLPRVRA
jgi:hypothetical protein